MMYLTARLTDMNLPWVNIEVSARSKRRKFKRYDIGYNLEDRRFVRNQTVLDLEDYNPGALAEIEKLVLKHKHSLVKVVIRHKKEEWE